MNIHQMKKCKEWVKKYFPPHILNDVFADSVSERLYEFIMPYRRNVQNLKKDIRYLRGEIARLKAQ
jgi:hypothetical protein